MQAQDARDEKGIRITMGLSLGVAVMVTGHVALWLVARYSVLSNDRASQFSDYVLACGVLVIVTYLFRHRRSTQSISGVSE